MVGYYVADGQLNEEELRKYLEGKLPEYMIPSILVYIDKLPLTINGKLDRKALPDPEFGSDQDSYVAPRSELEVQVCRIWSEVLGISEEKVGIRDDFFRLGGNSILAIKLASKLNRILGNIVNISAIFKHKTVVSLLHYLTNDGQEAVIIERANIVALEDQLLSYAQERLWFIEEYEGGSNAYNVPMLFKLSNDISLGALGSSLKAIVNRHEILRTVIKIDQEGNGYQLVLDEQNNRFEIERKKLEEAAELENEFSKAVNHIFDLSNDYPIRVVLYELDKNIKQYNNTQKLYVNLEMSLKLK